MTEKNRKKAPYRKKEENYNDTSIRTRKVVFTDMEPVHTPPPTIPGMISLKKSGRAKEEKTTEEDNRSIQNRVAGNKNKKSTKKSPNNAPSRAKKSSSDNMQKRSRKATDKNHADAPNTTSAVQKQQKRRRNKKNRTSTASITSSVPETTVDADDNRTKAHDILVQCRFQYSGKGYGFGIPLESENGTEDIFLPPGETCGAMTGDIVSVERSATRGTNNVRGPEGTVHEICAHTVTRITGVVAMDENGDPVVLPDGDRYKITVSIPRKDTVNLNAPAGIKVAVEPIGAPYFRREAFSNAIKHTANGRRRHGNDQTASRSPEVRGRITAVFGNAETRSANYEAILHDADIPLTFPPSVLRTAEEVSREPLTTHGRRDLRGAPIFTIDGANAKDLDDAISLVKTDRGYILSVHIADVSHYAPPGSCVEKEARERGTSVYFVDQVIPMLPESLSNGACSLNAGEDKYALTCEIALDCNGRRTECTVYRSLIRSQIRGVYDEVNALFDNRAEPSVREKYAAVLPSLAEMQHLYELLRHNSMERGVLELAETEAEIRLDANGMPIELRRRERGTAERMIEQFMLTANTAIAELLHHHNLPCLYRIHEPPEAEKIAAFGLFAHNLGMAAGDITAESVQSPNRLSHSLCRILAEAEERGFGETVSAVLLRSMMKAKYTAECKPHFGLGTPVYCHFTSPIRRYPDLFVHTVLNAVLPYAPDGVLSMETSLTGNAMPEERTACVAEHGAWATECEIRAQTAERRIEDLYVALFMREHVGEEFDAVVSGVMSFGIFARCENTAEGLIPAHTMESMVVSETEYRFRYRNRSYTLGSPLRVRLESADIASGKLTFSLI